MLTPSEGAALSRRRIVRDNEGMRAKPGRMVMVLVMQCAVVLLCVAVTTVIAVSVQESSIRTAVRARVLDVSQSLAALPQVHAAVPGDRAAATRSLQPLATTVQNAAGVDYVVITDADGIRVTHPQREARGKPVSTDPTEVLSGETFVGTETGTLGPTLRAKVPIVVGDDVIGTVSVGILESEIATDLADAIAGLMPWVVGSVLVGCVASAGLTALLRRRMRRLEQDARELDVQRRIARALRDQTHEFDTRLHVIRGLVAEGQNDAALEYVGGIAAVTGADDRGLIADAALRALLDAIAGDLAAGGGRLRVGATSTVPRGMLDDDDLTVIGNLVRNAVEATGGQGTLDVTVRLDEGMLHIEVADDGPGIDRDMAERIFHRGMSTKSGPERGVGLDLVRRVVRSRNGTIEVGQSALGGARFAVDLPAKESRHR